MQAPAWYDRAPRDPKLRVIWLAAQVLWLSDEWRETHEADPKNGVLACPVHTRDHLGDDVDPDDRAVCPLCAISTRVRQMKRRHSQLEVV